MTKVLLQTKKTTNVTKIPVLPLRDIVVFPNMIAPLFVGRESSANALKTALSLKNKVLLVTQKESSKNNPTPKDLYTVGTLGQILQLLKLPDGTIKVLIEGLKRAEIKDIHSNNGILYADYKLYSDTPTKEDFTAYMRTAIELFAEYIRFNPQIALNTLEAVKNVNDPNRLADTLAAHLLIKLSLKQQLLEIVNPGQRLETVCGFMDNEISLLQAEKRIRQRVKTQMEKTQRDYYLNEQIKAIHQELGDSETTIDELTQLEEKIKKTALSQEAKEKAVGELYKLKNMNPISSEANIIRNYLEWLLDIPWQKNTKLDKSIQQAEKILDEDHYGLEKVKEHILEHLAVQSRVGKVKSSILCLVGPPGVGKTSLGESISRATGRVFVRMALGGVHDESEIRGHRKTYIGAMPGKFIKGMKKAGTSNPLFLLDEVDKIDSDWRGDPAAALLEVLDSEQNDKFNDNFLEVDYDLSNVMFVTTANSLNISPPLLDRMEIIRLSGYTEEEKIEIARRHLLPKQFALHGLKEEEWSISAQALLSIIRYYTREAGVRNLERSIAKLLRKAVRELEGNAKKCNIKINECNLSSYLGVHKYSHGEQEKNDVIGTATGLAWTEAGGDILFIESVLLPGKGKMTITGKLGEVMQESVQAATSFVKSNAASFGIAPPLFENNNIHVHVPEGATPKDGPSAGIAICTAIVSMLTGIPVCCNVAMTGEITLRGRVLPIGGLKEKLLAAKRAGITIVIIPKDNLKDLKEMSTQVKSGLTIIPVEHASEVIEHALSKRPTEIIWNNSSCKEDITTDVITTH